MIKILYNLSFRETEEELKNHLPKNLVPDHTTLYYRFKNFPLEILKRLIKETAQKILEKVGAKEVYTLIADGTGFGYDEAYYIKEKRGLI